MLTEQQLNYRRSKVTASDARVIMNATDDAELLKLFNVKLGVTDTDPETYAMRACTAMEPVIINEYELRSGEKLTRRQEIVDHPLNKNFCCTLDGWQASRRTVVECKFASHFMSRDDIFRYYYPQVAFQMDCTDAAEGLLVVGQGTTEPIEIECVRSVEYEIELQTRCLNFLRSLQTMTPPVALPDPPIPPEKWRTVDLNVDQPNWAGDMMIALLDYDATAEAAINHSNAGVTARQLVPDDVGKVIAGNFLLTRNKRGVISIRRVA